MSGSASVTHWIRQLKAGDRAAVQQLWQGYFRRLVGLARQKLGERRPRAADEEDVALAAFDSFCRAAENGRFSDLNDRDDLWQLLVVLTARKTVNLVKREAAEKRGGGRVVNESALAPADGGEPFFARLISTDPDPALAAQLAEEYQRRIGVLAEDERLVARRKMEGYTNREIADELGRAEITVERKLRLIRLRLEQGLEP
jgi:DNA-directed RNA polymerase specialized sigma24 family protein